MTKNQHLTIDKIYLKDQNHELEDVMLEYYQI